MADAITPNYGLVKPENTQSRDTWGLKWNANADKIDLNLKQVADQISNLNGATLIEKINEYITANPATIFNATRLNGQDGTYYRTYSNFLGTVPAGALPSSVWTDSNAPSKLAYTGSSSSNTNYPVGSYVMVQVDTPVARNGTMTPALGTSGVTGIVNGGTGAQLSGTWRARGKSSDNLIQLAQRVS